MICLLKHYPLNPKDHHQHSQKPKHRSRKAKTPYLLDRRSPDLAVGIWRSCSILIQCAAIGHSLSMNHKATIPIWLIELFSGSDGLI